VTAERGSEHTAQAMWAVLALIIGLLLTWSGVNDWRPFKGQASAVSTTAQPPVTPSVSTSPTETKAPRPSATTTTPKRSVGPFKAGSTDIPQPLVGSWHGAMREGEGSGLMIYPMNTFFRSGANEVGVTGTSDYPTLSCAGDLMVTDVTENEVMLNETITSGSCDNTYYKVSLLSSKSISMSFSRSFDGYPEGTAKLSRVK
jgi:hypothetical protein